MGNSYCGLTLEKCSLHEESVVSHLGKRKYTGKWKLAVRFTGEDMKTKWAKFKKMPSADQVEDKVNAIAQELVLDEAADTDSSAASPLVIRKPYKLRLPFVDHTTGESVLLLFGG